MQPLRLNRRDLLGGALAAAPALCPRRAGAAPRPLFAAERTEDAILVKAASGPAVLRYLRRSTGEGACFTHPVYTPAGELVTDLSPADLPHVRGVCCGWADIHGDRTGDWWGGAKSPRDGRLIVNRAATALEGARNTQLRLVNSWRAEGVSVLEEVLTLTVSAAPQSYVVDYDYQFTPPTGTPVTLARRPYGGFCYRAMPGGALVVSGPEGVLDRPDSLAAKPQTNWPASRWYDFTYTTADGTKSGLALIDHPQNPHSTWFVSRSLHLLNPCIVADASITLSSRAPLRLRYRLVPHDGDVQPSEIGKLVEAFSR